MYKADVADWVGAAPLHQNALVDANAGTLRAFSTRRDFSKTSLLLHEPRFDCSQLFKNNDFSRCHLHHIGVNAARNQVLLGGPHRGIPPKLFRRAPLTQPPLSSRMKQRLQRAARLRDAVFHLPRR
jgi:hypothetical protein